MSILNDLEQGHVRVVEDGVVQTDVKELILGEFKNQSKQVKDFAWEDKLQWMQNFDRKNFRACPGAWVRRGVFIGAKVILMPCFVNVGAHIGAGTMIDSGVTVGSCAQIGENCHISANTVIAGVLEPVQSMPVIIEDNCFIGAQCVLAEGVRIKKNSVLAAGCIITGSTRIYDRRTGQHSFGEVPENVVVVPGSYVCDHGLSVQCVIIVKSNVSEETASKSSLNADLRS